MGASCSLSTCKGQGSVANQTPANDPLSVIKDTPDGIKPDYRIGDLLGKGSFGNVYKALHKKSHREFAIKIMDRAKIKPTSIHREWNVLEHLGHHPYIVDYVGTYKTRDHVYFVMECMYGGELFDRLIRRGAYAEVEVRTPFRNLASALAYLHSQGIVHRDLKPENILLSDTSDFPVMKIADFGLSQLIAPNERLLKVCGTWAYAAPEMSDPSRPGYDCRFDVFSFGVILYVVLSGTHPFDPTGDLPVNDIKAKARAVQYDFSQPEWALVSDAAKDLIRKLIVKDPEQRLTSREMLQHKWFSEDSTIPKLMPPAAGDDRGEGILLQPPRPSHLQQHAAGGNGMPSPDAASPAGVAAPPRHTTQSSEQQESRSAAAATSLRPAPPALRRARPDAGTQHGEAGAAEEDTARSLARGTSQKGSGSAVVAPAPAAGNNRAASSGVQISVARTLATTAGLQLGMQMTVVAGHDGTLQLVPTSSLLPAASPLHAASPHHPLAQYRDDATGAISMASPLYGGRQQVVSSPAGSAAPQRFAAMSPEDTVVVANVLHSGSADGPGLSVARGVAGLQRRAPVSALGVGVDRGPDPSPQQRGAEGSSVIDVELSRGGTATSGGVGGGYYSHLVITSDAADALTGGGDAGSREGIDHAQSQQPQSQLPKDNGPVGTSAGGSLRSAGAGAPPVAGPWIPQSINPGGAPQAAVRAWASAADGAAAADYRGALSRQQQQQQYVSPWLSFGAGYGWGGDVFADPSAAAWRLPPFLDSSGMPMPLMPGEAGLTSFRDGGGDLRKAADALQPPATLAGLEPDGHPFSAASRQQQLQFEAWQLARSGFVVPMPPPWAVMPSPPGWSPQFGEMAPHPLGGAGGHMSGMYMDPYAMLALQQQQQQQFAQVQQQGSGADSARGTAGPGRGHPHLQQQQQLQQQQLQQQQQQLQQFQQQQQQLVAAAYNQAVMAQQQHAHAQGQGPQLGQIPLLPAALATPGMGSARGAGGAISYDVVSATARGGSFERFTSTPPHEQRQAPVLASSSSAHREKQPSRSGLSVPCGAFQDDPRAAEHDSPDACLPGSIVPLPVDKVDSDPHFTLATGTFRAVDASDAQVSPLPAGSARSRHNGLRAHEVVSARVSPLSDHASSSPPRSAPAE